MIGAGKPEMSRCASKSCQGRLGYNPRVDLDIVIVGGGLGGASLAAALAESGLRLALVERKAPSSPGPEWDSRIYALTPATTAFLDRVGAWRALQPRPPPPLYDHRLPALNGPPPPPPPPSHTPRPPPPP